MVTYSPTFASPYVGGVGVVVEACSGGVVGGTGGEFG